MKDFMSKKEKEVRELSLITNAPTHPDQAFNEWETKMELEEAHYYHTINAFVELIVLYGWDKVVGDLRTAMGEKEW